MDLPTANLLASLITYAIAITIGLRYLAPALRRRSLAGALTILVWFHAFRHVALQIFSAASIGGLHASASAQRTIAIGDLTTAVLALITLFWQLISRRHEPLGHPPSHQGCARPLISNLTHAPAPAAGTHRRADRATRS
jgi:hypothetical protein